MEKIIKNKKTDLYVFLAIALIIGAISFYISLDFYDELWNFSNIYKMNNGYTIYNDLNVIITPLFFYIGEILFKILGANFLTFRFYGCITNIFFWFMIYKVFNGLKVNKLNSAFYTLIIFLLAKIVINVSANYNILAITLYMLGIFIHLKIDRNKKYLPIIQGLITFTIFITKQNIGIYYLIACFIMHMIYILRNKEIKIEALKFIKQLFTCIILVLIFLGILYLQGNLQSFIDYCFLGINEFAIENILLEPSSIILAVTIIINIAFSIYILKTDKVDENIKDNNIKMMPFTIMIIFIMYPLANLFHGYAAFTVGIILLMANISKILIEEIVDKNKLRKIYKVLISITLIYFSVRFIVTNYIYCKSLSLYINPYFGSTITEEQIDNINKVCDFIKENNKNGIDVKIISYKSDLYVNVLNQNNGKMDLPFKGNLGGKGEDGLIDEISMLTNTKVLIQKDDEIFWQESQKVRDYIKDNFKCEGEIEDFLIYSK